MVSRGSRMGFQLTETFSWEKQNLIENREVSQRAKKKDVQSRVSKNTPHSGNKASLKRLLAQQTPSNQGSLGLLLSFL